MWSQRLFAWFRLVGLLGRESRSGQTLPTAARIESVPLELTMPERYQVAEFSSRSGVSP